MNMLYFSTIDFAVLGFNFSNVKRSTLYIVLEAASWLFSAFHS